MNDPHSSTPGYGRQNDGVLGFVRRHIWKIAILSAFTSVTALRFVAINRPPPPPVMKQLGDFQLLDHNGAPFTRASMKGRVWVVGFIFTRCPTVCPKVAQEMMALEEQIRHGGISDHVNLLAVSVDPENDTPAVLKEYAGNLGANLENWFFVTGDKAEIEKFVVDGFMLAVEDRTEVTPGVYDIAHSTKLALVDREGGLRAFFSTTADDGEGNKDELFHRMLQVIRAEPGE